MTTTYAIRNKNLKPIPQENDATCWLAAYQMMFDWKGKTKDSIQTMLEAALTKKRSDESFLKGLDKSDWEKAAKAFGMNSVAGKKPFTASELAGYLANGPVLVHGKFALGLHSIVITAVTVADNSWEEDRESTTYINPYWKGDKVVAPRTSFFKDYLKQGVENNNGVAGVIQYW
ncbi:MAG TPA: papain-like cysteine protease family protein [Pyrinomonadaceae bacterium]|jgi:hypothetical protein